MRTRIALVLIALCALAVPLRADSPSREAGAHFQRGVELYNDGDFRGALVEFKRAYTIWPRANVLYDIGQTEFQLLDYASALKTMERYLAETGPNAAHRGEVENTVETLRGRVGRIALTTDASDCDVTIDDQPAGQTPLGAVVLVSVGPRKISVTCPGRPASVRTVEISAGETTRVDMKLRPPVTATALRGSVPPPVEAPKYMSKASLALSWSATALVAAATIGVGSATLVQQSHLEQLKQTYPVTKPDLDKQASTVQALSIASDVLGAATLAMLGVSTWVTVKFEKDKKLRLGLAGPRLVMSGNF